MTVSQPESPRIVLEIERLAYQGVAVGHLDGMACLVEGALPEERVEAEIIERHPRYVRARLLRVLQPSPARVEPPCPVFGRCGGCHLLHAAYALQEAAKNQFARDAFRRRPDHTARVRDTVPAPYPLRFRNRMSYSIANTPNGPVAGLHARGDPKAVVPAHACVLCPEWHGEILQRTAAVLAWHANDTSTWPRRLDLREGRRTGERMAVLAPPPAAPLLSDWLRECGPRVDSVVIGEASAAGGSPMRCRPVQGRGWIEERMENWTFEIGPNTFFQTFTEQAETMFRAVADLAAALTPRRVVELYAGVGALTAFLSPAVESILAAEVHAPSVAMARRNLRRNRIKNVRFVRSDAARLRPTPGQPTPGLLVLDPPAHRFGSRRARSCACMGRSRADLRIVRSNDARP